MEKNKITKEHWMEYRTPSGNWSKVKHDYEEAIITDEEFLRFISPDYMWKGDRVSRSYTRLGYVPYRITNVSPCGTTRFVYEFDVK